MAVPVQLAQNEEAEAHSFDGKLLAITVPRALAPGQPVELRVLLDPPLPLSGRSIGSRRRDDGRYEARLRLVNLTREARQQLARALAAP